ncbi:E3 ubiquitin-protein ligase RSL1-like [Vicia villosa]|uniref:E3 ubiquitin-protein ligase RSL1-like n=1 Tax=Vicia villosa TaxID=3911 RepID=UPI00273B143C|nr:E3 ubiquitin-protein ligase RSL1-like [Vicia villosa]
MQNSKKRKSLSEDNDDENRKKATTSRHLQSLSAKELQIITKRKPLSEDRYEKNKKTNKATTSRQPSKRRCGICFDSVTDSEIFTNTSCNHPFCTRCISKYVKLQRKDKVVKLNCPDPQCSLKLKPQHLESILPKELIVEWESAIYESSISLKKKIYCPYKNCSVMMVNDGEEVVTSCECPSCHRLFCAQCKVPWHVDMSCRRFQKSTKGQHEKELDEKFMELAKRKKWQKCPKCSMHVQRNGGCEHISCRCGCNFCYKCGKDWIHGHICKHSR